ncbi:MAG: hypothetical protein COW45_06755 [Gallionellales bacterium CG17_big_fil_post_rev_8_21_14_2_50_54_146]|nr:MAG: hypothetical protein COW45_06755 [Gallionellales bacterium CG17_big_fil_post_rev_8_21_14_2_50_54_146]
MNQATQESFHIQTWAHQPEAYRCLRRLKGIPSQFTALHQHRHNLRPVGVPQHGQHFLAGLKGAQGQT